MYRWSTLKIFLCIHSPLAGTNISFTSTIQVAQVIKGLVKQDTCSPHKQSSVLY